MPLALDLLWASGYIQENLLTYLHLGCVSRIWADPAAPPLTLQAPIQGLSGVGWSRVAKRLPHGSAVVGGCLTISSDHVPMSSWVHRVKMRDVCVVILGPQLPNDRRWSTRLPADWEVRGVVLRGLRVANLSATPAEMVRSLVVEARELHLLRCSEYAVSQVIPHVNARRLCITACPRLERVEVRSGVEYLGLCRNPQLQRVDIPNGLRSLSVVQCPGLMHLPQFPRSMRRLRVDAGLLLGAPQGPQGTRSIRSLCLEGCVVDRPYGTEFRAVEMTEALVMANDPDEDGGPTGCTIIGDSMRVVESGMLPKPPLVTPRLDRTPGQVAAVLLSQPPSEVIHCLSSVAFYDAGTDIGMVCMGDGAAWGRSRT